MHHVDDSFCSCLTMTRSRRRRQLGRINMYEIQLFVVQCQQRRRKKGGRAHNIKQKAKCIKVPSLALIAKHIEVDLKLVLTTILSRKSCSLSHFSYYKASAGFFLFQITTRTCKEQGLNLFPQWRAAFQQARSIHFLARMTFRLPNVY